MTWTGSLILSLLGAGLIVLVWRFPILLVSIGVIVALIVSSNFEENRRLERLAADRGGESICSFARSFDCRTVDTWIIRAVFEELQPYCRFGRRTLPLRRTDEFDGDLNIDPEELENVLVGIAYRAGRSLEEGDKNPLYGKVETVSDLVLFLANQPRQTA